MPGKRVVCGKQGASSVNADFSTQVQRMKALGFNAVKLPFSFKTLLGTGAPPKVPLKCTTATAAQIQVPFLSANLIESGDRHLLGRKSSN